MNAIERMAAARAGEKPDRVLFLPAVLEHVAAVIGVTPSAAAQDAALMAQAHIAAWHRYGHDAVTVGIDIYNLEAEALGCEVRFYADNSIPGVVRRPGDGMAAGEFLPLLTAAAGRALHGGKAAPAAAGGAKG